MIYRFFHAGNRNRTGTGVTTHRILSPGRLPVPPHQHMINIYKITLILQATQEGLEPLTSAVTGQRSNQLSYWAGSMDPRGLEPRTVRL